MANFLSFTPLLVKYLGLKKPKTILEWGPGHSTRIMASECPDAEIDSYETDERYYQVARFDFVNNSHVRIHYVPDQLECAKAPILLDKWFDLIFVDGRKRVTCMKTAKDILASDGVVLLHDCEREEYAEGIKLYRVLESLEGTIALGLPEQV